MDKTKKTGTWIFNAPCKGYDGVGRFVLGLPEDVEVLNPTELKDFLLRKIKKVKYFKKVLD